MKLKLRLAQDVDAESLMRLINAAFHKAEGYIIGCDRADLEMVRSLLAKGEFLVAEDDATLVGCVYLEHKGKRAYLGLLSVSPERQGAGVGSILMRESEQRCMREGCRFIDLKTLDLRTDNRAFYKRRGYLETGTEPFPPELKTKLPCHFVKMSKPLV